MNKQNAFRLAPLVAFLLSVAPVAAKSPANVIPARGGNIVITPIFHASLQIEYRGKVIQVDPFSMGDYSRAKKADLILITDIHPDHLDKAAITRVSSRYVHIFAPPAVAAQLGNVIPASRGTVSTLENGGVLNFFTNTGHSKNADFLIRIGAVPMYNIQRGPKPGQKFHTKGRGNGYVLTMGGKRIYIAGDTEVTPEMRGLKNIDAAFLPMNLPFTMTPQEAAEGVKAFKPKIVFPYHYRYPFDKPNSNPYQFKAALQGQPQGQPVDVRILQWYPTPAAKTR